MTTLTATLLTTLILTAASTIAEAESEVAHRETVKRDLFAVITLSGSHCEEVVDYELKNETNYVVTCKNGKRFRIHVTDEGRVEVGSHQD
jgi:hypothetical protein